MADQPDKITEAFTAGLDKLSNGMEQLQATLNALYEMLKAQGIRPTYHLDQALNEIREGVHIVQSSSEQAQRQRTQLHELVRTGTLITSSLNLGQVLEEVIDTVIQLTGAERAYLMLYDEDDQLQIRTARNWDRETLSEREVRFSQGIIDAAIVGGESIITTNAQTDDRFGARESVVIQQLRSILCIPLAMRGQTVGVLYADNRFQQAIFQEDIVPILTAFGAQAAVAIQNARAYSEVRDNLAEAQREIYRLRIQIDQSRLDREVTQITESTYFQELSKKAKAIRKEQKEKETGKKRGKQES